MAQTHRLVLVALLTAFAATVATPSTAFADEAAAQAFFEKGAALYFEGKFAEALVQFKKGHAESPAALFQYNIAVCNLRLERYREALKAAREARSMGGLELDDSTRNDARIAAIPRVQTSLRLAEAMVAVASATEEPASTQGDIDIVEPAPEPAPRFGALGWAGVGSGVVGGGLMLGALAVELSLQPKWDDYNAAATAGDAERFAELKTEIEDGQQVGKVLLFSGIGLAAVGATLVVVDLVTPGDRAARAGVFLLPDGSAGGSFSVRF